MRRLFMFFSGLATGVAVGVGTATLLTPMSGKELAEEAQARLDALKEEARKASEARKAELEAQLAEMTDGAVVFEFQSQS
jgi:gas vesicle protein